MSDWLIERMPIIVALLVAFTAVAFCCAIWYRGETQGISAIEDPTERGLAYIAVAIIAHAIFAKGSK
jgi:hypothetical protein